MLLVWAASPTWHLLGNKEDALGKEVGTHGVGRRWHVVTSDLPEVCGAHASRPPTGASSDTRGLSHSHISLAGCRFSTKLQSHGRSFHIRCFTSGIGHTNFPARKRLQIYFLLYFELRVDITVCLTTLVLHVEAVHISGILVSTMPAWIGSMLASCPSRTVSNTSLLRVRHKPPCAVTSQPSTIPREIDHKTWVLGVITSGLGERGIRLGHRI